jgi:peptidoglycan/LPS O-acetylase OafA/YrhL
VLKANHTRVQRLTPREVWLFIIGRVLAAFGVGILIARYQPRLAGSLAWPALLAGVLCLAVASRGMLRPAPSGEDGNGV